MERVSTSYLGTLKGMMLVDEANLINQGMLRFFKQIYTPCDHVSL